MDPSNNRVQINNNPGVQMAGNQPVIGQLPAAPITPPPASFNMGPVVSAAPASAPAPKTKGSLNSTQNSLKIAEIRDGIVIMNDGSFRSVVMVKSINFDLMSPQEQEAVPTDNHACWTPSLQFGVSSVKIG